jgi:hypothetical protein
MDRLGFGDDKPGSSPGSLPVIGDHSIRDQPIGSKPGAMTHIGDSVRQHYVSYADRGKQMFEIPAHARLLSQALSDRVGK